MYKSSPYCKLVETTWIYQRDLQNGPTGGGEWRWLCTVRTGKDIRIKSEFVEIVPFKKIVFQHFNPNYIATIVFESKEKETLVEWTMLFETIELLETVAKVFKADEGLKQNTEKPENYLKQKIQ